MAMDIFAWVLIAIVLAAGVWVWWLEHRKD